MMNHLGKGYRQLITLAALASLAPALSAQEPVPTTPQREHTVRRGDTLWDLAGHYLGNPFLWPMIYEANRTVVEDPHWIYPGEVLVIPGMAAPAAPEVLGEPVVEQAPPIEATPVDTPAAQLSTVDLRRPIIPLAEYYSTPWLSTSPAAPLVGRIARIWDPSAEEDKIPAKLHPHYRVHVGQLRNARAGVGDTLLAVRIGREVKGWGRIVEPLALLQVDSVTPSVITATVVLQFSDAQVGDDVMPLEAMPAIPLGRPEPVEGGPQGRLLQFFEPQPIYGTGDQAFVSLGAGQLQVGDEIAVYVPARRISDDRADVVPPAEVARGLVVRLTDRTATVRLTKVVDTVIRDGLPVRLVGRTQ